MEVPGLRKGGLVTFVIFAIDSKASVFIARHASGPSLVKFVLALDDFALRGRHIGRKRKQKTTCDALLHCDTRAWVGVIAA